MIEEKEVDINTIKDEYFRKGFKHGKEHKEPSQTTSNFIVKMEEEIKNIKEKLEKIPTRDEMLLCIEQSLDKFLDKANNKFASKITEKIVWGIMGAVGLSLLSCLGYLVYTAIIHFGK